MPQDVYERLKDTFVLIERGDVEIRAGLMRTWYLVDRKPDTANRPLAAETGGVTDDDTKESLIATSPSTGTP